MDQVYVYTVEDGCAGSWAAELAVRAAIPADALRILREAGLRKAQLQGSTRPSRSMSVAEFGHEAFGSRGIARRVFEDDGWQPWAMVPAGFSLNWRDSADAQLHNPIDGSFRRTTEEPNT